MKLILPPRHQNWRIYSELKKKRNLLEIVFAKLLSGGNRTRQGFSRFDIIHYGPLYVVLGLRIEFLLCFIKCAVKRGSLFVAAAKVLCKSHCTGYCATTCAEACLLRLRRSCASRTALATALLPALWSCTSHASHDF